MNKDNWIFAQKIDIIQQISTKSMPKNLSRIQPSQVALILIANIGQVE